MRVAWWLEPSAGCCNGRSCCVSERDTIRVTIFAVLGHRLRDYPIEFDGYIRRNPARCRYPPTQMRVHQLGQGITRIRGLTGQQVEEAAPQRIDVRTTIERGSLELLG